MRAALLSLFAASFVLNVPNQQSEPPARPVVLREFATGPDGLEFFGIVSIAIEPKIGALWILSGKPGDPPTRIVRSDKSATTIGRKGGGPDEFTGTIALAPGRDGQMGVYDVLRRTIAWVDSSGRHARTWSALAAVMASRDFFSDTSGRVFLGIAVRGPPVQGTQWATPDIVVARLDSARGLIDTIVIGRPGAKATWTSITTNGDNVTRRGHEVLFAARPSWSVDAHGRLYSATGDSSLVIVSERGRTRTIVLPPLRDPLTPKEKSAVGRSLDFFVALSGKGTVTYDHARPPVPDFHPEVEGLVPDMNGGVAVLRSIACERLPWKPMVKELTWLDRGPFLPRCRLVERYNASGQHLRPFALMPDDRLAVVRGDTVWVVRKAEDDTERIIEMVVPAR